jgi:hypothetical protein
MKNSKTGAISCRIAEEIQLVDSKEELRKALASYQAQLSQPNSGSEDLASFLTDFQDCRVLAILRCSTNSLTHLMSNQFAL